MKIMPIVSVNNNSNKNSQLQNQPAFKAKFAPEFEKGLRNTLRNTFDMDETRGIIKRLLLNKQIKQITKAILGTKSEIGKRRIPYDNKIVDPTIKVFNAYDGPSISAFHSERPNAQGIAALPIDKSKTPQEIANTFVESCEKAVLDLNAKDNSYLNATTKLVGNEEALAGAIK